MNSSSRTQEEDISQDLQGVAPEQRDAILAAIMEAENARVRSDEFEVWPENWETVQFFLSLSTQWMLAPMGGLLGLRYESIVAVMKLSGVPKKTRSALFQGLRIMEAAVLEETRKETR